MKIDKKKIVLLNEFTKNLDATLKAINEENGTFSFVVSTEDRDRHREIVKQDGLDFSDYKKNPIVLADHDYRLEKIVGKTLTIKTDKKQTSITGVFASTEYAQFVRKLYEEEIPLMTSIGFIPKEYDDNDQSIITKSELLEISIVGIGSNRGALRKLSPEVKQKCVDFGFIKSLNEIEKKGEVSEELNNQGMEKQKMFRPVDDIIQSMYYVWYD